MSDKGKALQKAEGCAAMLEEILLRHARQFLDDRAAALVSDLLLQAAGGEAVGYDEIGSDWIIQAEGRRAADLLLHLPQHRKAKHFRDKTEELPETRRRIWDAMLKAMLRSVYGSRISIGQTLLTRTEYSEKEEAVLRECIRERLRQMSNDQALDILGILKERPGEYEPIALRALFIAVAHWGSYELLEALIDGKRIKIPD